MQTAVDFAKAVVQLPNMFIEGASKMLTATQGSISLPTRRSGLTTSTQANQSTSQPRKGLGS